MHLGRNDPCHCGSGKKYMKCCLAKDEEAGRIAQAESAVPANSASSIAKQSDRSAKPPDPHIEAGNTRWDEFEAAGYEDKLDLFHRILDDPVLMDGDMAFEMLDQLFGETIEHGERDRFDALIANLRERRPEAYAEEAHYFLSWQITNAVAAGRSDAVPSLALELAPLAGKQIDVFSRVENQLAYHGHLSTLVEAMRIAWPPVESSSEIVPWAIDEFFTKARAYELLDYVERAPALDAADSALRERLEFYGEIAPERLSAYLAHLTGRAGRNWTMSDFEFAPPRRSRRDWDDEEEEGEADESALPQPSGEQNFFHLTLEFLGYLRRVEGMPYAKGELGRGELQQFILDRHSGSLEFQESMPQTMQRKQDRERGRRRPPKRKFGQYEHILVPDRERLDRFISGLLGMMNPLYYHASAVFEIIPAWLRFLESRGLIDAKARAKAFSNLAGLTGAMRQIFDDFGADPAPRQACERWQEQMNRTFPE